MREDDVMVVGLGMRTSVGLTALETAASVRAATCRFSELHWPDRHAEPFVTSEVPHDGLPGLPDALDTEVATSRERRLWQLGASPLVECLESLPPRVRTLTLILAVPEFAMRFLRGSRTFARNLIAHTPTSIKIRAGDRMPKGRAGGLVAIAEAIRHLRAGLSDFVVVGGVDTYRELAVLEMLDRQERVKSIHNLDGFVPGEGAAFLLLTTRRTAHEAGLVASATLSAVATAFEEGHLYSTVPYRGEALAMAFQTLWQQTALPDPIGEVYSSMTGESHWAKEWGVAYLRNKVAFAPDPRVHHPSDCFGDVGAASGPLMIGLAAIGIRCGYRRSPCLVFCSSDFGDRAVLAVSRA